MEVNMLTENKKAKPKTTTESSIVPAGTQLLTFFRHNVTKVKKKYKIISLIFFEKKHTELVVQTNNTAIVKSLVVFAEQILANESETK